MRVLIIGGTGLISTAITRQLVARGDSVTLFNRGKTDARVPDGVRFLHGDRKEYPEFEKALSGTTWDAVIDMVGFVPEDAVSAVRTFRGNVGQFIFCSTVCVYGGELSHLPAREDESRTPTGNYGRNKVACEDLFMEAYDGDRFPVTIMRPSHTYGEGGVIVHSLGWGTTFLDRIRKGKPVVVHGDGTSLWVSCHIDDAARGFVGALGNRKAIGKAYNVTGEDWRTWNGYVLGVADAIGGTADIVHIPTDVLGKLAPKRASATVDIFQYNSVFDNGAAMKDLGFRYTVSWVEGVRRTVAWLDEQDKIANSDDDPFDDRLIDGWRSSCDRLATELVLK
jgi:nucleoside-diphosphate-sugar epimerase